MTPVWCIHCREPLGDKIEAWEALRPENDHIAVNKDGRSSADIFSALGLDRACCRGSVLTCNARIDDYNK